MTQASSLSAIFILLSLLESEPQSLPNVDLHCGPRCVQRVLKDYGREEELTDLIRELQGGPPLRPTSLLAIEKALRDRGVHTKALRIAGNADIHWPSAVVVHLSGGETTGHFVVQYPSSDPSEAVVWLGLTGRQSIPTQGIAARRSGFILLTSQDPIEDISGAVAVRRGLLWMWAVTLTGFCVVAAVVMRSRRLRSQIFGKKE